MSNPIIHECLVTSLPQAPSQKPISQTPSKSHLGCDGTRVFSMKASHSGHTCPHWHSKLFQEFQACYHLTEDWESGTASLGFSVGVSHKARTCPPGPWSSLKTSLCGCYQNPQPRRLLDPEIKSIQYDKSQFSKDLLGCHK